ncbi:MAG: hypothetical protein ABIS01_05155, partial [Ferruginibacter sp.]
TKNKVLKTGIELGSFKMISALPANFEMPRTKASRIFIEIKNADNPPLKIERIRLKQLSVSLVAYLEQGKKYNLVFGDSLASFADYDLQIFKDSINMPQPLNYGKINIIKRPIAGNGTRNKNWWIWVCIILAGIILSFLTFRLIGDINKSKN